MTARSADEVEEAAVLAYDARLEAAERTLRVAIARAQQVRDAECHAALVELDDVMSSL